MSHTRRYIHRSEEQRDNPVRNSRPLASVLVGAQEDLDYDAIAELVFEDEDAFKAFYAVTIAHPENGRESLLMSRTFLITVGCLRLS